MDKKTAVYICTGCGIGEAIDAEKLSEVANDEYSPALCKSHPFLCGPEGIEIIRKDIEGEDIDTLIIAACSHRVNYDVFDFGPEKIVERVNIREQVAWTQAAMEEDTQMLAEDNLRIACTKVNDMELPVPFEAEEDFQKTYLL